VTSRECRGGTVTSVGTSVDARHDAPSGHQSTLRSTLRLVLPTADPVPHICAISGLFV